jgi:hypothetical protein
VQQDFHTPLQAAFYGVAKIVVQTFFDARLRLVTRLASRQTCLPAGRGGQATRSSAEA